MSRPYFQLSRGKILEQYDQADQIADIVSYSSKTNPMVTSILEKERSCLFSIHMKNEIKNIRDTSRILFLAQAWDRREIKGLLEMKIRWFVVDNEEDLDILLSFLENYDYEINLLLRLKLKENSLRTEKYFVFGMKSEVINRRILELHENPKVKELGIHFHRKTQNISEWNLQYEISHCIEAEVMGKISVMNIGGGLPSHYANTNVDMVSTVLRKVKKFKDWLNSKGIKMMIEPGRFIAAPSGKLVTNIVSIHENNIVVNASVYNTDMDALIVPVKLLVEGELEKNVGDSYVIKGITPCSMDLFRYRVYLKNPKKGDEIIFLNAGAYNFSTQFCDLDKLKTEVVE
jgi:ornithine decarboxylase